MIRILSMLVVCSLITGCGGWSWKDTARQSAFLGTTYVAYSQVHDVSKKVYSSEMVQQSGMLEYPKPSKIDQYFLSYALGHTALAMVISPPYRSDFQWLGIGLSVGSAVYGFSMKINIP